MTKETKQTTEYRSRPIDEIRADDETGKVVIRGHAAVFERETQFDNMFGKFREIISRGAFSNALARGDDVVLNVNHQGLPLARTKSGTLELTEDDVGLAVRAELDMTDPDVQRLKPKLERGDLSEMSFAFFVDKHSWDRTDKENPMRRIEAVELRDVSVVTRPAYGGTDVGVAMRSLQDERIKERATAYKAWLERRKKLTITITNTALPKAMRMQPDANKSGDSLTPKSDG